MNAVLRGDFAARDAITNDFNLKLKPTVPRRNIYWTGNYTRLQEMAARILETHQGVEKGAVDQQAR